MTGEEFVRGVMERLGVSSAAALADAMRWPRGKERTVARWLAGESNPSYENVMEMVQRAGLLSSDAGVPSDSRVPGDPLEALSASVDQMADRMAAVLDRLDADMKELASRIPPAGARRRRSA